MTTATDTQRIYVASLSDYNGGILHGVWIDLSEVDDIDDLWAKVNAMLAASPSTKKYGDVAEEWAIHDYEGFGGWKLWENENLEKVLMVANLIANKGAAFATWVGNDESVLNGDYDEVEEKFDEAYRGEWEWDAFVEDLVGELGWGGLSAEEIDQKEIGSYLDYGKIGRDLEMDYWHEDGFVFWRHA